MKPSFKCWLIFFLACTPAFAGDDVTITMTHYAAGKPLPRGLDENSMAAHGIKPGCALTFLVQGTNLAGLKPESLKILVLRTKDGRDVRTINGKPSYQELSPFASETHDGRFGKFTLELDASLYDEVSTLEVQGTIQVFVAEGIDKLASPEFPPAKHLEFKLGDILVKTTGDQPPASDFPVVVAPSLPAPGGSAPSPDQGNSTAPSDTNRPYFAPRNSDDKPPANVRAPEPSQKKEQAPDESKLIRKLCVELQGPGEKVAGIRLLRKNQPITPESWSTGGTISNYEFSLDGNPSAGGLLSLFGMPAAEPDKKPDAATEELLKQPVKVELATWKNLRTITIPIQHNAPKK